MLDEVYAKPTDLGVRAVYADYLQERGDPRGEFIAIQLAHLRGEETAKSLAREAALLAKHRKKWLPPLAKRFTTHVFEGGFFAGGRLDPSAKAPLDDRDWRFVRRLDGGRRAKELLTDERSHVRVVDAHESELLDLAKHVPLRSLNVRLDDDWPRGVRHWLETPMPALRELAIEGILYDRVFDLLLTAKLVEQLELLVLPEDSLAEKLVPKLCKRTSCKFALQTPLAEGYRRLSRPKAGRFDREVVRAVEPIDGSRLVWHIERALGTRVRSLEVDTVEPIEIGDAQTDLAKMRAKAAKAKLATSFQVDEPATAPLAGTRYYGQVSTRKALKLRTIVPLFLELDQGFDTYAVDDKRAKKLDLAAFYADAKRASDRIALRRSGDAAHVDFLTSSISVVYFRIVSTRSTDELVAWIARFLDTSEDWFLWSFGVDDKRRRFGWIQRRRRIAKPPKLDGVRTVQTAHHTIVIAAPTPGKATNARLAAIDEAFSRSR